ncbi:unnamed protein product [Caenorhabditis bovis]|uniref:Uncharacterized protein n=1 Tax=Caenorhabditis bovis TaxID=2654633 RepID=A0A8S1EM04_9PELO|nr:unnamed protein product [Caenorhabditis bovis]
MNERSSKVALIENRIILVKALFFSYNLGSLRLPPLLRLEQRRLWLASLAPRKMASVVVVASGAALAVTVPFIALKELLEKRTMSNMKKHLGRKSVCRVNFGNIEDSYAAEYVKSQKNQKQADAYSTDDEDRASTTSAPPQYEDLFNPPPPSYESKDLSKFE